MDRPSRWRLRRVVVALGLTAAGTLLTAGPAHAGPLRCTVLDSDTAETDKSKLVASVSVCEEYSARWIEVNGRLYDTNCDGNAVFAEFTPEGEDDVRDKFSGGCGSSMPVFHTFGYDSHSYIDMRTWARGNFADGARLEW